MARRYDVFAAQVGDRITVASGSGGRTEMTVWQLVPALSAGRSVSAGPTVMAHIRPGGYGVSFDAQTAVNYDPHWAED